MSKTTAPLKKHRINRSIRADKLQVIDDDGNNLGLISLEKALDLASIKGQDLVQMSDGDVAVAKIMDYGKFLYQSQKKSKKSKSPTGCLKETQFRLRISDHDYQTKIERMRGYLRKGYKAKGMVLLIGRENHQPQKALEFLSKVVEDLGADIKKVEQAPKLEGRRGLVIVSG